ncbi:unnamed protein product, partial [Ostreobium quekettii]
VFHCISRNVLQRIKQEETAVSTPPALPNFKISREREPFKKPKKKHSSCC